MVFDNLFNKTLSLFCFLLLVVLIEQALPYEHKADITAKNIMELSEFTYEFGSVKDDISLPDSLSNLPPKTPVTFYTEFTPKEGDCLYIKSVYSQLRLYANDRLIYSCGETGSFPALLIDPPTLISIVEVPYTGSSVKLRLEYKSPSQRDILTAHPILVGKHGDLLNHLLSQYIFSFLLSIVLIFLGIIVIFVSFALLRVEPSLSALLWLGVFSFCTGIWIFGECNLTALFFPYPSLLYLLAFIGLFSFSIPLLKFGLISLDLHHKKLLSCLLVMMKVFLLSAAFLQLLGLVAFSRSMYLFHVAIPITLAVFSACIIWDALRLKNLMARRFLFPMSILAIAASLELLNYQIRFTHNMSSFFQIGSCIFILMLGGIGGYFIRDALQMKEEKRSLEFEIKLKEQQIEMQKMQQSLLMQNAVAVKEQRHDLRHQLTVIKHFSDTGDSEKLNNYLTELVTKIPTEKDISLCENSAVNAVTLFYVMLAKAENIHVTTQLCIPTDIGRVQDSDLCIILGNFLENALAACRQMQDGEKFIKISSTIRRNALIIVMDNSFNGIYRRDGECFLSQKRTDRSCGLGLSSIQTVAKKYDGFAKFEVKNKVFCSSVYVYL